MSEDGEYVEVMLPSLNNIGRFFTLPEGEKLKIDIEINKPLYFTIFQFFMRESLSRYLTFFAAITNAPPINTT